MNTTRPVLTKSAVPQDAGRRWGSRTPLLDRLNARDPQPTPEPRKPEWLRRMDEGKLPAKELLA